VYLESAEEPLVDTANVLAELVGQALERGELDVEAFYASAERVNTRNVAARIYEMLKERVDLAMYITDAQGRVLFDSRGRETVGRDYSRWRDVSRTLSGVYGARVSSNPQDRSLPRVLYVAAPIMVHGRIAGSLTVVKPTTSVNNFLHAVRPRLFMLGALASTAAILLALLVSLWVTQQVGRLTHYAEEVRAGRRVAFPKLAATELLHMGLAFENMRASLAGQTYVEQYVRALTHEIKSPISAIRGAAEILETSALDQNQRARFLGNIQNETHRIQDLVDRMLELSELEVRRALPALRQVALAPIVRTILEAQQPMFSQKALRTELELADDLMVRGDAFLLHLALSNLIKNALEFSPRGGCISVRGECVAHEVRVSIADEGPGIPDFAMQRIFERFYSLERPDTGRRSTGLGLNFVTEIAALHRGSVRVENRAERGLLASMTMPAA
jgi:two-component system sensor histidine kinase CreC